MPVFKPHKTSSLHKTANIYCHLLTKEYCTKSSHRRIHHILGNLMIKGSYTFRKSWSQVSKKHIACDGRFAFFDNYENCIDCGSPCKGPCLKFTVQRDRLGKIEDALLMEAFPESVNVVEKGYRSSLFALVRGNFLLRVDMETGKTREELYIGPPSVKYKRIQWNVVEESFTLCSTLTPGGPAAHRLRQALPGHTEQEVIQLTIMYCLPLEFVCKLSVTRKVFGHDTADASIFLNILMVMHSTSHVRMYSLERVLEECVTHRHKLYDKLPDGTVYGVYPSHLTHNVRLKECPPCLFEVRCRNHDVMITMPPCYYIMWPMGNFNGYCCFSFKTRQIVEGGLLDAEESEFEERVSLHADDSGRIIHMKNSQLRMLKLQTKNSSDERHLVEDFVIDFRQTPKAPAVRVTQSGRVVKQRVIENCSKLTDRIVLTMVYNEDYDLILVVSASDPSDTCDLPNHTVVGFYDNWTGTLLRQFMMEESVTEALERSVCFSLDTITHVFKTGHGRIECHVYKLQADRNMQDEWNDVRRAVREPSHQTSRGASRRKQR